MFKQKIKLSLVEDYINLLKIDKILLSYEECEKVALNNINEQLKHCYESLFLKYGLLDLSFLVLKKEVENVRCVVDYSLGYVENLQKQIINNMLFKLKKLKLNDVEIGFLTNKLNVKNC